MSTFVKHLKKPGLIPLFSVLGFGIIMGAGMVASHLLKSPEETWPADPEDNLESCEAIKPGQ